MNELAIARALHVIGVVIWIGGVSMATTAALPALRCGVFGADRLAAFQAFERRFVWQARGAVVLVGLSGLVMVMKMDLWARFAESGFWWMHAMVGLWLVFAIVPLIASRWAPGKREVCRKPADNDKSANQAEAPITTRTDP
ncbi:hypothetical protein, partial [Acetobacter malorum]|uniref:hypothetical protein n=1 Tax=Acetobacter malorum TaxID=178901 RepID=UPI000A44632E